MKFSNLTKCPFCGSEEFYTKTYAKGYLFHRERFDEEEADNTDLFESLFYRSMPNKAYCAGCNTYLGDPEKNTVGKAVEKYMHQQKVEK